VLRVADTGTGLAAEDTERIFDRFFKGPTSRGSGLGLTIARNRVSAHRGDIRCVSGLEMGTTFKITLPQDAPPGEK
jgi:signal transduction histidine kinase